MTTLTITSRGQVTFRKDVLQHLGIKPGGKIELDLLPDGRGMIKAARPAVAIDGLSACWPGGLKKLPPSMKSTRLLRKAGLAKSESHR